MLKVNKFQSSLDIECSAELQNIDLIVSIVKKFLIQFQDKTNLFGLFIALREALNNAIIHGARCNPDLSVRCHMELKGRKIYCVIEDSGNGFNWQHLLEQNDINEVGYVDSSVPIHGWGIFLLKKYSDGLKYYGTGNKLSFWFNLDKKI